MGFSAVAGGLLVTYGYPYTRDTHFFDVSAQAWRALPVLPEKGGWCRLQGATHPARRYSMALPLCSAAALPQVPPAVETT